MPVDQCPECGGQLEGLATYCHVCEEYVADMGTTSATPRAPAPVIVDDRDEETIQAATVRDLELLGFHVYDLSQGRKTRQTPGLGDLYIVGHGVCAWAEMKSATGKPTPDQRTFGERVNANGGAWLVWSHESQAAEWARGVMR